MHYRASVCQGGSEGPLDGGGVGGTLETHAADVASYAAAIGKPVLCGHSFGGLVVQQAVSSRAPTRPAVAGVALLCSVPPAGNGPMVCSRMHVFLLARHNTGHRLACRWGACCARRRFRRCA
jgi:pimeloyl-ACP methyl ester carboxylesterase